MQDSLERELQGREKRTPGGERYYWYSDIPSLIGQGTPSMSSFRRRVNEGKIHTVTVEGQEEAAFLAEDVRKFLRGNFNKQRGGAHHKKVAVPSEPKPKASPSPIVSPLMDNARPDDLPAIYFMESIQLGFERAIFPTSILSWLSKNDHAYWLLSDASDRKDVKAVLGVLSVKESLISPLVQGELLARDIPVEDTFAFEPGRKHTCFVTSVTTLPGWYGSVTPLFQRLLSYWCERSVEVEKIYLLVPSPGEESAPLHLAQDYFFSPLDEHGDNPLVCRLRPMRFSLSSLAQEYRTCIQKISLKKEENSVVNTLNAPVAPPVLKVEEELGSRIREKPRDFARVAHGLYDVDENGRLVKGGDIVDGVIFREVKSDEDILATLRINASLFGGSKKYTEEQLVAHRRQWLQKNKDIYRILEVDRRVVGFINAFPFPDEIIDRILRGEMRVGDVPLEALREYVPGQKTNVYLQTVGIHKDFQGQIKRRYGVYMISGFSSLVNDLGRRGIALGSLFTRSDEIDGINLSYGLGLKKYPVPGVEKIVFRLDFDDISNPFLHEYQAALAASQASQFLKSRVG